MDKNSPLSGNELKSPQSNSCTLSFCPLRRSVLAESSIILFSSLLNIIVWISFTSQNSGSQWMCAVQTSIGCANVDESVGTPETRHNSRILLYFDNFLKLLWPCHLPFSQAASLVFSRAAKPILSFGMTRFNILSEPSLLAIAS